MCAAFLCFSPTRYSASHSPYSTSQLARLVVPVSGFPDISRPAIRPSTSSWVRPLEGVS